MDEIKKLLLKIHKKDRDKILFVIKMLTAGDTNGLDIKKIIGTSYYRTRVGRYRIIFFYFENNIIIYRVRLRNDNTYNE